MALRTRKTAASSSTCAENDNAKRMRFAKPGEREKIMRLERRSWLAAIVSIALLGGCATATRAVKPPIPEVPPDAGDRCEVRQARQQQRAKENLVILAFSGGGTRAAAFSFGVLEFLRNTEVTGPLGNKMRLLDAVDVITGVSGGSFTALAYG